MYYKRISEELTEKYLSQFRVLGIMGPRQSGKSTMIKHLLQDSYTYVSFDKIENRNFFYTNPKAFITQYNRHIIFDEVQQIPDLFPMIKLIVDENPDDSGRFVLTGSGQFLLSKNISESLAGRIGLVRLLPMLYIETPISYQSRFLINGGYPEVVSGHFKDTSDYFDSYLNTYLQKDLRSMLNVTDLSAFTQLIRLLAVRVAQPLNLSDISKELGLSVATLSKWVSVLEASYIIFLLRPYYRNMGKRLVKTPKIYFYDNGLLSFLTGIHSQEQLKNGDMMGSFFENFIISEIQKTIFHKGYFADLYFIRTSHGDEIDLVLDFRSSVKLIEIKSSNTLKDDYLKTIDKLAEKNNSKIVIYQGETKQIRTDVKAWNYKEFFQSELNLI